MDQNVMFKTAAFGGFEKKAVLDYILKINQSTEQMRADLTGQIEALQEEKQGLEQALKQAEEKQQWFERELDSSGSSLAGERNRLATLEMELEKLRKENAGQKEMLSSQEERLSQLSQANQELEDRNRELESHKQEVEHGSAQIGRLLIEAHADADKIVDAAHQTGEDALRKARQEAVEIRAQAERESEEALALARVKAAEMEDNARSALQSSVERFSAFRLNMEDLQSTVRSAARTLEAQMEEIDQALAGAERQLGGVVEAEEALSYTEEPEAPQEDPQEEPFFRAAAEE